MTSFDIPTSFSVFFWFSFVGILLFQGSMHALILLFLKSWKYNHVGNRWAEVMWINFFWIAVFLWISSWVYEWGHSTLFDSIWIGLSLLLHLALSGWCLIRSARWAAYEA